MYPKFGSFSDQKKSFEKYMVGFQIEFYWFKKRLQNKDDVLDIRILHMSMNLNQSQFEMEKIETHIKKLGFNLFRHQKCNNQKIKNEWIGADLILYGTDNSNYSLVQRCVKETYGFFTMHPQNGVLIYSIDPNLTNFLDLSKLETYAGPNFAETAICLLYTKIKFSHVFRDALALDGWITIEKHILAICPNCSSYNAKSVRNKFRTYCDKKKYKGNDVDLFFAAIDIIRPHRHQSGHIDKSLDASEEKRDAIKKFTDIAQNCGFNNDIQGLYKDDNIYEHRKWISRLTMLAVDWLRKLQNCESIDSRPPAC